MFFFLLLLDATTIDNTETTILARPSGAPYVFYKQEDKELAEEENQNSENVQIAETNDVLKEEP